MDVPGRRFCAVEEKRQTASDKMIELSAPGIGGATREVDAPRAGRRRRVNARRRPNFCR